MLQRLLSHTSHPINLSVLRIAVCLRFLLGTDYGVIFRFGRLGPSLVAAPEGWGALMPFVPIDETSARVACVGFVIAVTLALLGLWTRWALVATCVLGIYFLGIPQFFGRINHYHHLIWFTALLAAGRSAEVLSVDAAIAAWRGRARPEPWAALEVSDAPRRCVWLLVGLIYFFPGYWKVKECGLAWASGENLQLILYQAWFEHRGWTTPLRLDEIPQFLHLAALGTLAFEFAFVGLVWSRWLRPWLFVGGLAFHNSTYMMMKIGFFPLQACYVALLEWQTLLAALGRRLAPEPIELVYGDARAFSTRLARLVARFDVLDRVRLAAGDGGALKARVGGREVEADAALALVLERVPLLRPLRPFMRRHLRGDRGAAPNARDGSFAPGPDREAARDASLAVVLVGAFLVSGSFVSGFYRIASWPIGHYPTFAFFASTEAKTLGVRLTFASGETRTVYPLQERLLGEAFTPERLRSLLGMILRAEGEPERRQKFAAFWDAWVALDPRIQAASSVAVVVGTFSVLPARSAAPEREEPWLAFR